MTSKKLRFYADSGLNVSIINHVLNSESTEGAELNYIGVGIFGNLALQFNVTGNFYMETGLNGTINFISYQNGYYKTETFGKIDYEDTGTFDLFWSAPYIHIGWYI
jgi:hypothetical protein